jgi:protein involved in polysaccharide export with SLBB domain
LLATFAAPIAVPAQQGADDTANASDLSIQNLGRVAASPAELRSVLLSDVGLMVELKRWVARDATSHGQLVSDPDLTNDAIFDRLDRDVLFRSVATEMVQRYGYLLPKLNPDSEPGKERALLIQERAKWLAQNQEEELAQARHRGTQNPQPQETGSPKTRSDQSAPQQGSQPQKTLPTKPSPPISPAADENNMLRAQVARTGQDLTPVAVSQPLGQSVGQPLSAQSGTPRVPPVGENYEIENPSNELLAVYESGPSPAVAGGPFGQRAASTLPPEPPQLIRKPGPYDSIPSLYDMYVQAVTTPAAPKRFGLDVFDKATQNSQLIPMDLPAGPDYVVGPGDSLSVELWGGVSQRLYRTVDREGRVSLPEVGPILVSGKSLAAVQQNLQQILRTQFRDVSADVSLARLRTVRVYEVGDVTNPGAYDLSSLSTPLNALFAAGGPTGRGSLRILKHYRGAQLVQTVDVYDLLLHGVKTDLQRLENGDTVQVPPIGPQVTVEGMVRRPAIYELRDEKTLASVLELAGGLLPAAALNHIEVQRLVSHEKQTMLSIDIPESENAAEAVKKLEAFEIQDGDQIRIYPIAPYNQDSIYLEGHALRPGRYSFHVDMRVTDVISSYQDLLPEPAPQYAEIVRLNGPDFHPSVESFNLADALADPSQAPVLHPMDTIRIFSRFDFENPPSISVLGDVRKPGTYRTSGQIHLSDAVHLAGGLTPDAQTAEAQIFRYLPDGKFKIFSIGLGRALEGDAAEDILMEPRDRLLIHRNPDAVEQATVYIQGEVAKPGRYPLAQGMRVSDLIRLGGGLKHSADPGMADLIEYMTQNKAVGAHHEVNISAALAGASADNPLLSNGDTLTIRQVPGWNDLGSSATVRGEVPHPGVYGIRPGERLSSLLARAGGFLPSAYPEGIVFEREEVRKLEQTNRDNLIRRIRLEGTSVKRSLTDSGSDQAALAQATLAQRDSQIAALEQAPVTGRLVVRLTSDLAHFRGSPDDIEVRRGDTLFIPKRPQFVVVSGQVYNANAITYRPRRNAGWYLRQAGGPTDQGNVKMAFVIRANGSVVSRQGSALWSESALSTVVEPGDTIVVPEKALGGSQGWQNLIAIAQLAQAAATTAFIATR